MSFFQINTNIAGLNAYRALTKVSNDTYKAQLKLATQKRINSVSDDTSGYNVGKSLEGRVNIMKAAQGNVSAAKDMLATAETALQNIKDLLIQIKGKVTDSNDPTKDKASLVSDIQALGGEISNILNRTEFNGTTLLTGTSFSSGFSYQTGISTSDTLSLGYTSQLGTVSLSSITGVSTSTIGSLSVSTVDTSVSNALGSIGNDMQRLDVQDTYLSSAIINAQSSISRLFDTDMALEQLNATKSSIGTQVATAMFSQLNAAPNSVLSLFR